MKGYYRAVNCVILLRLYEKKKVLNWNLGKMIIISLYSSIFCNRKFPGTEVNINASSEDVIKEKPTSTHSRLSTNKVDVMPVVTEKDYQYEKDIRISKV